MCKTRELCSRLLKFLLLIIFGEKLKFALFFFFFLCAGEDKGQIPSKMNFLRAAVLNEHLNVDYLGAVF